MIFTVGEPVCFVAQALERVAGLLEGSSGSVTVAEVILAVTLQASCCLACINVIMPEGGRQAIAAA